MRTCIAIVFALGWTIVATAGVALAFQASMSGAGGFHVNPGASSNLTINGMMNPTPNQSPQRFR
ncbi:MAG: hypothetical protein ACYDC3_18805, partial [Candidatus Binataceae bacterium]